MSEPHADRVGSDSSVSWTASFDATVRTVTAPIVTGEAVALGIATTGVTGGVVAFDAADGVARWTTATERDVEARPAGDIEARPTGDAAEIFAGTNGGRVYGLAAGGSRRWATSVPATAVVSTGQTGDSGVYAAEFRGRVRSLDPRTGLGRWVRETDGSLVAPVTVGDGTVYAATSRGKVHAFTADGTERWTYAGDGSITVPPVADGETLAVGRLDGTAVGLDPETGTARWRADTGSPATAVAFASGSVVVGTRAGSTFAFDAATGEERWRTDSESEIVALDADPAVYAQTSTGTISALDPETGALRWRHAEARRNSRGRGLAVGEGAVYAATDDRLTALATR